MISHKYKFIFIHVQRTGGRSIKAAISKFDREAWDTIGHHQAESGKELYGAHLFARDVREHLGDEIWNSYFKFSIVRNPWDRLVSWYNKIVINGPKTNFPHKLWQYFREHATSFEAFLQCTDVIVEAHGEARSFAFNQIDHLGDSNGKILVDYVGRFEQLSESFAEISRRIGLPDVRLPVTHRVRHKHYSTYYSEETRRLVAERFQRDIDTFGYQFEKSGVMANYLNEVILGSETRFNSIKQSFKKHFPTLTPYYSRWKNFITRT